MEEYMKKYERLAQLKKETVDDAQPVNMKVMNKSPSFDPVAMVSTIYEAYQ